MHRSAAAGRAGTSRDSYTVTGRELLLGSSFHLASDGRESGAAAVAAWGRVATVGGFEADVDEVRLDGEVTTAMRGGGHLARAAGSRARRWP